MIRLGCYDNHAICHLQLLILWVCSTNRTDVISQVNQHMIWKICSAAGMWTHQPNLSINRWRADLSNLCDQIIQMRGCVEKSPDHVYFVHPSTDVSADISVECRSTYRPILGQDLGWHIDRHSTNISTEVCWSVCRSIGRSRYRSIGYRHCADTLCNCSPCVILIEGFVCFANWRPRPLNTRQWEAVTVSLLSLPPHPYAMNPTATTHGHFVLSPFSLASRDQNGGPSNSTIGIYDLTEK